MTILVSLTAIVWTLSMDGRAAMIDRAEQFIAMAHQAVLVTRWEVPQPANIEAADLGLAAMILRDIEPLPELGMVGPENPAEEMADDEDSADAAALLNAIDPDIGPPPEVAQIQPVRPEAEAADAAGVAEAADAVDPGEPAEATEAAETAEVTKAAAEVVASKATYAEAQQAIRGLWHRTSDLAAQLRSRIPALLNKARLTVPSTPHRFSFRSLLPR